MSAALATPDHFPRLAIPAAVLFAIAAPALQSVLDLGLSAAEFADQGDQTLRAAGYAFSIWSLIYLGLALYALHQARRGQRDSPVLNRMAPAACAAIVGCGAWIAASAADWRWATVVIILASAAAAVAAMDRGVQARPDRAERVFAVWPVGLLGGWLTVASVINLVTVLSSEGLIGASARTPAAVAGIAAAAVVALAVTWRTAQLPYAGAVAWGLVAVFVAHRMDRPQAAWTALASAAALLGVWALAARVRGRRAA